MISTSTLLIMIIAFCGIVHSEEQMTSEDGQLRQRRNIYRNFEDDGVKNNCFDAFEICRKDSKCRTALLELDSKCKVVERSCNSQMVDLPRCGQIMDHLFLFGFPQTKCRCPDNSEKCQKMYEKIYRNPCFVSIRHLRKAKVFPTELNAYDAAKGLERTTTSPSQVTSLNNVIINPVLASKQRKETTMSFFDEVFGDKKLTQQFQSRSKLKSEISRERTITSSPFVKNKSRRKENVRRHHQKQKDLPIKVGSVSLSDNPKLGQNVAEQRKTTGSFMTTTTIGPRRHVKTSEGRKIEVLRENKVMATFEMKENEGRVEFEIPQEYVWEEGNTDFKAIAIILGILLGMFLLTIIVLFAWTRARISILHKPGKLVPDVSKEEAPDQTYLTNRPYHSHQHRSYQENV